jgi:hypothetical protein
MNPLRRAAVPLLVLALAAPAARADLVRLFDGKTVEGKVSRSGGKVTVKGYKGKSTTYAASEVKFVEEAKCTWEVASDMAKAIPGDASDALFVDKHLEIARYLKERRVYGAELQELETKEYEAVLRKSPDNDEARTGLGHVKWGTWWFKNDAERDKFRKNAPAADMEPKGFVKYKKTGMWEVKEDVEALEAGKVKFRGRWMTEDEKKEAEGYVKDEKGSWILKRDMVDRERSQEMEKAVGEKPVAVMSNDRFRLVSWFPVAETAQLKELATKTYAAHKELLGNPNAAPGAEEEVLFVDPIEVFLVVTADRREKWVKAFGKNFGWTDELVNHRMGDGVGGFEGFSPYAYFLCSGRRVEKNRERDAEEDLERAKETVTSYVGIVMLERIRGNDMPGWLYEANSLLAEIRNNETASCTHSSMTKYREEVANKQGSKAKYFDFMKQQVTGGLDRSLLQIFSLELNNVDWADAVKCWSFLEFLIARYKPEYQELMRRPIAGVEEIQPIHVDAAVKARKPKDPAAAPLPGKEPKDEGAIPTAPIKVEGPDAAAITEGSKEERAIWAAKSEAWIVSVLKKDLATLEAEWKAWVQAHP